MIRSLAGRVGKVGLGAITLVVFVAVTLIFYLGFFQNWTREKGTKYVIDFTSSAQLQQGDPIKIDGVNSGRVDIIRSLPGDRGAQVTVEVLKDAGPLYDDARADLRWRLLLGGAFYVQIDPGTPSHPELPAGGTIPVERTSQQVELDDLSHAFQGGSQAGLRAMPAQVAQAFALPDVPKNALQAIARNAPSIQVGLHALRGQVLDRDLRGLVKGAAETVRNLDEPNGDLTTLISGAAATVQTINRRSAELRQTLDTAPRTMQELDLTLGRLEPTLRGADRLVTTLQRSAPDVAPTLSALRPTLVNADGLLRSARPLLRALSPAVRALAAAAKDGVPLINSLRPSLRRLDSNIIPYLAKPDPETGKSTTIMIGGTAAGFGGSAGQQDSNGHFIRFPASIGSHNVYLPCDIGAIDADATKALICDDLQTAVQNYLNYVPGTPGQSTRTARKAR
jgi:phospholipid/cholesterol/gamma-HCH transport system substrate-binding protein